MGIYSSSVALKPQRRLNLTQLHPCSTLKTEPKVFGQGHFLLLYNNTIIFKSVNQDVIKALITALIQVKKKNLILSICYHF